MKDCTELLSGEEKLFKVKLPEGIPETWSQNQPNEKPVADAALC